MVSSRSFFFSPRMVRTLSAKVQLNVFFFKTRQVGRDLDLLVGFADIHARKQLARRESRRTRASQSKPSNKSVDLLLQGGEAD